MGWRYRIEGTKNTSTFLRKETAIKKAKAKLRTQPCGRTISVDKIWVYPSGVVSYNKRGVRAGSNAVWTGENECKPLGAAKRRK